MKTAYLSLGSNLGDRLKMLSEAVRRLRSDHSRIIDISSVYETAPQGKTDQPNFLNIVVRLETDLEPLLLLRHVQQVESGLGRVREERWGPRTVDIDIVLYEGVTMEQALLTLPHPRMAERAFVLVPLLELDPALPYGAILETLPDQGVRRVMESRGFADLILGLQ